MAEPYTFTANRFTHWAGDVLRRYRTRLAFNRSRQIEFLSTLMALNKDGISVRYAISFIAETSTGIQKTLALHIEAQFQRGRSLADGLVGYYPAYIVESIRAGEASGSLSNGLEIAHDHLLSTGGIGAEFVKEMMYPGALIVFICILLSYMHGGLFASLAAGKDMALLPALFVFYHTLSGWLATWGLLLPVSLIAMVGVVRLMLARLGGSLRDNLDNLPVFQTYRMLMAARLLTSLGTLMLSGVAFRDAVRILRRSESRYLAMHLVRVLGRLARGIDMGPALDTGILFRVDILHLKLMSRSSQFDRALVTCGKHLMARVKTRLGVVAAGIRIMVMVMVALCGAGIYLVILDINTIVG